MKTWLKEFKEVFAHIIHYRAGRKNATSIELRYSFSTHFVSLIVITFIFAVVGTMAVVAINNIGQLILGPDDNLQASLERSITKDPLPITKQVDKNL